MEHRILIVDDDTIFNNLLSDVFRQAGYNVHSTGTADEAIELLKSTEVDLIVTDQRMPGTTGTQFVHKLLETHKGLPVVIVSGFLSNGDIRQLIEDGIGGVFIKPLNIFQLLKRAAQLIDKRESLLKAQSSGDDENHGSADTTPLSFRGASSPTAVKFIKQLEELRGFTSNLLLVGHEGTDFETLCQDLSNSSTDTTFFLTPEDADDAVKLSSRLSGLATNEGARITVVFDDVEAINPARTETILSLSRNKPPFDKLVTPVRFIFCLRSNLDALFDEGKVNENLYLFMGTMELKVPSLEDVREDIPAIAQSILENKLAAPCRLDDAAAAELKNLPWHGGTKHLVTILREAIAATPGNTISPETIRDAFEGKVSGTAGQGTETFAEHLLRERDEYVRAMLSLYAGDEQAAALGLEIREETLRKIVAAR
jgi:two-component system NtrC family response regulator